MKIRPLGAQLFLADVRTDRHDEANIRFSQFCKKRNRLINVGIMRFLLLVISSHDVVCVMALLTLFFIALSRFTCLVTICSRKIGRSLHHVAGCSLKFNICTETAERVYPSCHRESGLTSRSVVFFPCRKKSYPGWFSTQDIQELAAVRSSD